MTVAGLGLCLVFSREPLQVFLGEGGKDLIFTERSLSAKYCLSCFLHLTVSYSEIIIIPPFHRQGSSPERLNALLGAELGGVRLELSSCSFLLAWKA